MENKIKIAEKRYCEMENRKAEFMEKYKETGDLLNLELANVELENMNRIALAIMKAKKDLN